MVLGSNMSIQKTFYEVLSVSEDASYDEIRAAYKSAALNTHPDKAHTTPKSSVPSSEQEEFFMVQKAWEILRHPASRADYDKQLQSSKQNIEIIASEIEVRDMIVESTADTVELLYPCRCGDYFSITSCELGDMGIFVSGDGEVEHQVSDSASASVILGCGSCSLKVRTLSSVYTIECISSTETGPVAPPVFIFVVDTCMIEEEIGYLKYALEQAVELLPDNSLVGFITFGTYVQVHELGFGLLPKSYVFKGTKEVTKEQMCFFSGKKMPTTGVIAGTRDGLSSVIEEMQKDPWPVPADQRASSHQGALELP